MNREQIFSGGYLTFLFEKEELKAVLNEAAEEDNKESGGHGI